MPADKFRLSIKEWLKNSKAEREALVRQSVQELCARVVANTPVDTGFARGQWQPSLNAIEVPSRQTQDGKRATKAAADPSGGANAAKVAATIIGMKAGDVFYMSNNAAYIMRLEFGFQGEDKLGRTYHQAGRYFVTGALAEWPKIVAEQAALLGIKQVA